MSFTSADSVSALSRLFSENEHPFSTSAPGEVCMSIPDLLQFLAQHDVTTPLLLLSSDIVSLAGAYALEKQVDKQTALDFLGAARFFVRQHWP